MIMDEMWNDETHPNNIMTNWFSRMENVEIAAICCSPGYPATACCDNFFQITDSMMIKSMFSSAKAGRKINSLNIPESKNFYGKKRRWFSNELFRIFRSIIWRFGHYDLVELKKFLSDFSPDIIFSTRRGCIKIARLEMTIRNICNIPMVVYTGDDEYSFQYKSINPLALFHLWWTRRWLKKAYKRYDMLYCSSYDQMAKFEDKFGLKTKFLVKVGDFNLSNLHLKSNHPIEIVYAGKLYCNRYKTLKLLGEAIQDFNKNIGFSAYKLDVYTSDYLNKKYIRIFSKFESCFLNKAVSPNTLKDIYNNADILLHVEGLDRKNSRITSYSFSTKLIDCLSNGSATMIISKPYHSAYQYCKTNNIAFCASNKDEIKRILLSLYNNDASIFETAKKAMLFGIKNNSRSIIQKNILEDFTHIIKGN